MIKIFSFISIIILYFINGEESDPMNYIIDNIFLGDRYAAADIENLKKNNITTVVNCAREVVSNYTDIRYIELSFEDYEDEKIFPKFEVAYKFIKKHPENNILVHCAAGVSRSASVVIYYLMKEYKWDFKTCMNYTRERRPVVSEDSPYRKQLIEFYERNIKDKY